MGYASITNNFGSNAAAYGVNRWSAAAGASAARLASSNRHIRASDDVASMSVGSVIKGQMAGFRGSLSNALQGSSMMQTANGGIGQIIEILSEQQSLAAQAQNGSLTATERGFLNQQFQTLSAEIDQIASSTSFGNVKLLRGGLGTTLRLANTNALAAAFTPATADGNTGAATASTTAIQAFNSDTGVSLAGTGAAGNLDITNSAGAILADGAYDGASLALRGKFSSFRITNVTTGVAATLTATINGVEFSGTIAHNTTTALLNNGNHYIKLGVTAIALTNAGTVAAAEGNLSSSFANTSIMRTSQIHGVSFHGTALSGVTGAAATGIAMLRSAGDPDTANISNFRYLGSSGADTNVLAVDVNGKTFTATAVLDLVDAAGATSYAFESGDGEALTLNITGLTTPITNIRTSATDRHNFISALNVGFSRAGGGAQFNLGDNSNPLMVSLGSATSSSLYNGQMLDLSSTGSAATAQSTLEDAMDNALKIQAQIGSYQSSFEYSAASLESSLLGLEEGRSALLDTNVAEESTKFAVAQVQAQAAVAALAQANNLKSTLLDLMSA